MSYEGYAELLAYPRAGVPAGVVEAFDRAVSGMDATELEELYTRTFDVNPVCSLEVGWHLFGEDYQRGAFLVRMRQELRASGVEETAELPDHLVHVLRLLERQPAGEADVFARRFVHPAVEKMLAGLDGADNPYRLVIESLLAELARRHGEPEEGEVAADVGTPPYASPCGGCHGR